MARPTEYKPEYCELLIEHMSKGLSFEAFAGAVGVAKQTLYNWEKQFPEFLDAKAIGSGQSQIFWENLGINHVITRSESFGQGVSESKSLNASVWIFNMKNRFQWRDKQADEHDVVVNNVQSVKDDDLDKRIAVFEAMKAAKEALPPEPDLITDPTPDEPTEQT